MSNGRAERVILFGFFYLKYSYTSSRYNLRMRFLRHVVLVLCIGLLTACSTPSTEKPDFVIAAAADLQYAMDELSQQFQQQHPEATVRLSYGSSGQFAAQIEHGAPYDIFCSADLGYPRSLVSKGHAIQGTEFTYAIGRIVIWVPASSKIDVEKLGMESLRDPSVRTISIANPDHAPYGKAAVAAMKNLGVYDAVKDRLNYGENVAATLQYVQTENSEIGIVALSLAVAPHIKDTGRYWEVPIDSYPKMEQGGVILKATKNQTLAQAFRTFMLTEPAREVLKKYGFFLPS